MPIPFPRDDGLCEFLNRWCLFQRPRRIVEFGCGWSTAVLARHGHVTVFEEDTEYLAACSQEWGAQGLKAHLTLLRCEVKVGETGDCWYDVGDRAPEVADLVLIDGPRLSEGRRWLQPWNAVVLRDPASVIVDKRVETAAHLARGYGEPLRHGNLSIFVG